MNAFDIISAIVTHSDTKTRLLLAVVAPKWQQVALQHGYGKTHVCFHNLNDPQVSYKALERACVYYKTVRGTRMMKEMLVCNLQRAPRLSRRKHDRAKVMFRMIYDAEDLESDNIVIRMWASMIEAFGGQDFATSYFEMVAAACAEQA